MFEVQDSIDLIIDAYDRIPKDVKKCDIIPAMENFIMLVVNSIDIITNDICTYDPYCSDYDKAETIIGDLFEIQCSLSSLKKCLEDGELEEQETIEIFVDFFKKGNEFIRSINTIRYEYPYY